MVKLCLTVLAIGLAFYCAFYCGLFDTRVKKRESPCYPEAGSADEPTRRSTCPYVAPNDRRSLNCVPSHEAEQPSNGNNEPSAPLDRSPEVLRQAHQPSGSPQNDECRRRIENCPAERLRTRFTVDADPPGARVANNFQNPRTELSDNEPDYRRDPRAASTRLGPIDVPKTYSQHLATVRDKNNETPRGKTLEEIEKCCDLFFNDRRKNGEAGFNIGNQNDPPTPTPSKGISEARNFVKDQLRNIESFVHKNCRSPDKS